MGIIRLLLSLVVAGDHFTLVALGRAGWTKSGIDQWTYINGGVAVMVFYVISGFLISYALTEKYGAYGTTAFFKSRAIRIFSLYWPLLLINLLFFGGKYSWSGWDIFVNVFLFGGDWKLAFQAYPEELTPFLPSLGQIWSVSTEITFYVMAPFVLRSMPATVSLLLFSLATRITLQHVFGLHQAWVYHFLPSVLWFFLLGHLSRQVYDFGLTKARTTVMVLFVAAIILFAKGRYDSYANPWFYASFMCFALALPGVFDATKDNKVLNFFGNLSYPIYLVHMMVLWQCAPVGVIPNLLNLRVLAQSGIPLPLVVSVFLALVTAVSIATHFFIERPVVKVFRKVLETGEIRIAKIVRLVFPATEKTAGSGLEL